MVRRKACWQRVSDGRGLANFVDILGSYAAFFYTQV